MADARTRPAPGSLHRGARFCVRLFVRTLMRTYFRWRVVNRPNLEGGYVLVANHRSFLDPLVVGAASPNYVSFLMNTISFRNPLMGWFYRLFRSIPVAPHRRNRQALRDARAALEAGEVVGIFPEGGISRDGGFLLGNPGAVALVLKKSVSVVPVGLVGVGDAFPHGARLPRPKRIEVRFGEPIPAEELISGGDRKETLARATERLMRELAKLVGSASREEELARRQKKT